VGLPWSGGDLILLTSDGGDVRDGHTMLGEEKAGGMGVVATRSVRTRSHSEVSHSEFDPIFGWSQWDFGEGGRTNEELHSCSETAR
jgi:hypothetical protein